MTMAASPITEGRADRNASSAVGGSRVGSPTALGDFEEFYRSEYHRLLLFVMRLGSSAEEATDGSRTR